MSPTTPPVKEIESEYEVCGICLQSIVPGAMNNEVGITLANGMRVHLGCFDPEPPLPEPKLPPLGEPNS